MDAAGPDVVLLALPGYGRTTLASQWAARQRTRGRLVAWTSGPWAGDRAGAAAHDAVAATLRAAGREVADGASSDELGAAIDAAGAAGVSVALVVDGADDLVEHGDARDLADLLTTSGTLHVLLVTGPRVQPRTDLARALAAADPPPDVVTLSARDLAMTPAELRDAASGWGHALDDATAAQLVTLVGGWPGLARTVLDDTRPADGSLATAAGYAYARDTALPALADAGLLDVAMVLATASDPTGELVRDLLDATGQAPATDDDVDALLELEAIGVVDRLPADGTASRWHVPGLLREALRRELERRDPDLAAELNRILSRRALAALPPDPRAAVEHAARAEDWTLLETCWLDFGSYLAATGGPEVDVVYGAVPDQVTATSAVLAMARAAARRGHDERGDTRALVLRLMTELGTLALDGAWRSRTPAGRWTGAAAALVAARARGDMPRAMSVLRDTEIAAARAGVGGGTSSRSYWWFLVQAGRTALLDGDIGTALEMPMRAYELADPFRAPDVRAAAAGHVALVFSLDGLVVDAERWLVRHVETLDPAWEDQVRDIAADVGEAMVATDRLDLAGTDAALARVDLDVRAPDVSWPFVARARIRREVLFGSAEAGLAELDRIERTQHVWLSQAGLVRRILLRLRTELLLALGELDAVSELLVEPDPTGAWSDVPRARWHLMAGEPVPALRTAVVGGRRHHLNLSDRLDLLVLEAWAAHESRQPAPAVRAFRSARRIATEQGVLRSFAHLPVQVRDALVEQSGLGFDDDELARLAQAGQAAPDLGPPDPPPGQSSPGGGWSSFA